MASPLRRPITILVPVFGAAERLTACLDSLARFLPPGVDVEVLDDATPGDSIPAAVTPFLDTMPNLRYIRRPENLGFVENCNQGMRAIIERDSPFETDILLLNSDTEITAGAVEEMSAVLHLHEKHGAVCPRSNNATIFSVPLYGKPAPAEAYQIWRAVRSKLHRFQVMPTAVGFCMLIRYEVLRYFGYFDPIYSPGYNEENDLVSRMNRHGYSAVAANQAFVFHYEGFSFGSQRRSLEKRNRQLLDQRYPEYSRVVGEYFRFHRDPVERFSTLFQPAARKKILVDLYHIAPHHSGTSEFALNLLLHLAPLLESRHDLWIGTNPEARGFLEVELAGYAFFDEQRSPETVFDLVFKPCQLFFWSELHRMARLGARICCVQQDSIAMRCRYLCATSAELLQRNAPALFDRIIAISRFSEKDFNMLHGQANSFSLIYQAAENTVQSPGDGRSILIMGSKMQHKGVISAVRELLGLAPIVVLGGEPAGFDPTIVRWHRGGHLGKTEIAGLYEDASIVVYPSYYEGFGLPVLDGLSAGCDVIVLDTEVNRELKELTGHPRMHFAATHGEMRAVAEAIIAHPQPRIATALRSWADVAQEYDRALEELLNREIDCELVRTRWNWLSTIDSVAGISQVM